MTNLTDWIGRATQLDCWLDPWRAQALHATLDAGDAAPSAGAELWPCWHWLYFLDAAPSQQLGPDGHPQRGAFLPPVPLPRRMWAGSRVEFLAPITLGTQARKVSRVVGVEEKNGRSGRLCFVKVAHEIYSDAGLAIREEQDIVYRDVVPAGASPPPGQSSPTHAAWRRAWTFDSPRLFRYSALTFNSHRIHYDRDYAVHDEAYPGLVVHGPLLATLMLEPVRTQSPRRTVRRFEFRAIAPVFDGDTVHACGVPDGDGASPDGDGAKLWIQGVNGAVHMRGSVALE